MEPHRTKMLQSWASEGFFPGGPLRDFSKSFPGRPKNGNISFFPLEIMITTFFAEIFTNIPLQITLFGRLFVSVKVSGLLPEIK